MRLQITVPAAVSGCVTKKIAEMLTSLFLFFLLSPGVEMRTPQSMKLEMNPTEFCRNQKNIESDAGLAVRQKLGKVFLLFFSETWMSDLR